MNAPPFPLNPTVGQRFGNWLWDGNRWVSLANSGVQVIIKTFSESGPYMPSPGLVSAVVELVGGGGGGGGALGSVQGSGGTQGWCVGGGGGSAGTYVRSAIPAQLVRGGVIVTIGPGGTPGPATQATPGGRGGMSTFGALMLAEGGFGGASNVVTSTLDPGFGQGADPGVDGPGEGPGNIGDVSTWGGAGTSGSTTYYDTTVELSQTIAWGGQGGNSHFSGTWAAQIQSGAGAPGRDGHMAGAGGGGGASAYANQPSIGGAGAPGYCVVTEYVWGDQSGDDCGCGEPASVNLTGQLTLNKGWGGGHGPGPHPHGGQESFEPYGWSGDGES